MWYFGLLVVSCLGVLFCVVFWWVCLIAIITCLVLCGLCCDLVASSNIRVPEVCWFLCCGLVDLVGCGMICCGG